MQKTPLEVLTSPRGGLCHIYRLCDTAARSAVWKCSPCHANLINCSGKDIQYVYTTCWINKALDEEIGEAYFDFILDPEQSPFKRALKDVDIVKDANGKRVGFGCKNNGTPNQIIGALMIASRLPWEFPDYCRAFGFFKTFGFTPVEAYYLCYHFSYTKTGKIVKGQHMGHMTHNVQRGISLKCLIEGPNKTLNEAWTWMNGQPNYNPTINIWEKEETAKMGYGAYVKAFVHSCLNQKGKYTGVFLKTFKELHGGVDHFPGDDAIAHSAEEAAAIIMKTDRKEW